MYSGLSVKRQKYGSGLKRWWDVVKLGIAWERPFIVQSNPDGTEGPEGEWKVKKALRSFRPLPAPPGSEKDNGWAVEMVCPGEGDSRAQSFETKMPVGDGDEGKITFQIRRLEGGVRPQGSATGVIPASEAKIRTVTAVVDLLGKGGARVGSRIRKGKGTSKVVCDDIKPGVGWSMTPYPGFTGYVAIEIERKDMEGKLAKGWIIKQVDSQNCMLIEDKIWDLGGRKPDRFVGEGDTVVALCFDDPDQAEPSGNPQMPSNLVCIERYMDKSTRWLGKGETWRSRVRWEIDTSKEWADNSAYTAFAHLKNFHITKYVSYSLLLPRMLIDLPKRHHLVALVTRHPTAYTQKLTGTFFHVIDAHTGKLVNKIKLRKRIPTSTTAASQATPASANAANDSQIPTTPAAFTTACSHEFLITDNYIVCGGPGGGLHVYNYALHNSSLFAEICSNHHKASTLADDGNKPLYSLPDPWTPQSPFFRHNPDLMLSVPNDGMQGLFVSRQYSGLTLSTCGRYLGATTSDQFWVWDMVKKRLRGVWSNGRKVERRDWYSRSPSDRWMGGVWVLLNYQEEDGMVGGREGIKLQESLSHRGDMGKGKYISKVDSMGYDGEGEEEEIMVGYLTDLGVPVRGEDANQERVRLGLGINQHWAWWKEWWRNMQIDVMSTMAMFFISLFLAVFAVWLSIGYRS